MGTELVVDDPAHDARYDPASDLPVASLKAPSIIAVRRRRRPWRRRGRRSRAQQAAARGG